MTAAQTGHSWTGDVEPVAYPFCPGLISKPQGLAFDVAGDWLLANGIDGILQATKLDGSVTEIWPRAFAGGSVFKSVEAICGMDGGFAVCGRMSAPNFQFDATVAHKSDRIRNGSWSRITNSSTAVSRCTRSVRPADLGNGLHFRI